MCLMLIVASGSLAATYTVPTDGTLQAVVAGQHGGALGITEVARFARDGRVEALGPFHGDVVAEQAAGAFRRTWVVSWPTPENDPGRH